MNYIELLKESLGVTDSDIADKRADLEYIDSYLSQHDIKIKKPFLLPFVNHLLMMLDRFKSGEVSDLADMSSDEIGADSLALAKTLLRPLFEKYHVQSATEENLIAIYFQSLKEEEEDE